MILTTTNTIEHHKIMDYCGIVTGVSMKMRDISAFAGKEKHSQQMEDALNDLKEEAFKKLQSHAKALGANAVVGIHIDFEPVGTGYYFGVSVTGTAVKVAVP
ncbi:heavy metal-binding domain-containing protein [Winogradskyella echinorum]|uniref:Heavy metal-binding domain-containing protein n=1 Tax=Winogradskyella echinorum TaxID=538189 RepID=A0ABR6XZ73_9FLAO|nr:heavy metal-binding domain-containing protein [Winogradskyella echinorum]MBC3845775.1 heavy metal-binding domain-containing protein [Winogradskyella echinorum]MBC5750123.1 heavy metal-binding domain-containing protein [Winogradskyella echinorum]